MKKAKIHYFSLTDEMRKEEKLQWFSENRLQNISFDIIRPDKNANWINLSDNDFETLLPLMDKDVKAGNREEAIFKLYSRGFVTQRDEWVFDFSAKKLLTKINFLVEIYQNTLKNPNYIDKMLIKWDRELNTYLGRGIEKERIVKCAFRPFTKKYWYFDKHFDGMLYQWNTIYKVGDKKNLYITFRSFGSNRDFNTLVSNIPTELHLTGANQCLPLYRYDSEGNQVENITDWALQQFRKHYNSDASASVPLLQKEGLGEVNNPLPEGEVNNFVWQKIMNNPLYKEKRRELRKTSTPAEAKLWEILRNKQLDGYKFRRQHSVDFFILDFYCPECKLCIELDGAHHYTPEGLEYDEMRSLYLSKYGIQVIRFENKLVFEDIEGVLGEIRKAILTSPNPSFERRGSFADAKRVEKEDIFHYVYAVLHNPIYREKYETNLKREFPRIPFYTDFHKWVAWGKKLMDLHINYESVEPYPLVEKTIEKERPKAKLKAIKETGEIALDESTSLLKVPIEVYEYKLGNRSAVEWILDQYKESKPTDPTIAEKFNTYKFADYKTEVIELLKRVCTVSIETMKIIAEMNT